jgi:hypothetical protein
VDQPTLLEAYRVNRLWHRIVSSPESWRSFYCWNPVEYGRLKWMLPHVVASVPIVILSLQSDTLKRATDIASVHPNVRELTLSLGEQPLASLQLCTRLQTLKLSGHCISVSHETLMLPSSIQHLNLNGLLRISSLPSHGIENLLRLEIIGCYAFEQADLSSCHLLQHLSIHLRGVQRVTIIPPRKTWTNLLTVALTGNALGYGFSPTGVPVVPGGNLICFTPAPLLSHLSIGIPSSYLVDPSGTDGKITRQWIPPSPSYWPKLHHLTLEGFDRWYHTDFIDEGAETKESSWLERVLRSYDGDGVLPQLECVTLHLDGGLVDKLDVLTATSRAAHCFGIGRNGIINQRAYIPHIVDIRGLVKVDTLFVAHDAINKGSKDVNCSK